MSGCKAVVKGCGCLLPQAIQFILALVSYSSILNIMASLAQVSLVAISLLGLLALVACQSEASVDDVTVAFQEEAVLRCTLIRYTGMDTVTIAIEKVIGNSSTSIFSLSGVTGTLTILASSLSDAGEYRCTISIDAGGSNEQILTGSIQLVVEERFVFLTEPMDSLNTALGVTRRLLCLPNLGQITHWLKDDNVLQFDSRVTQFDLGITINDVTYADVGTYTCVAQYMGTEYETSAEVTVEGYMPPFGQIGFGLVKSSVTPVVECGLQGVPGPTQFYWQKGQALDSPRVTTLTNVSTGPFVDSMGRLDLTRATRNDSDIYRCVGIDVAGGMGSQFYNVEVIPNNGFVLATQWYFILLYVLLGIVFIVIVALLIWGAYSTRHHWFAKGEKTVRVKKRVRRHQATTKGLQDDFGAIDGYAT